MPASSDHDKWTEAEHEIISSLDLRSEYAALGVQISGYEPNSAGWLSVHAIGREDRTASAAINLHTGRYRDLGGQGESLNLWEFATKHGSYSTWKDARAEYARKARVTLPRGRPPIDPAEHLKFLDWNECLVRLWCLKKPPIISDAVRAAGGRWAKYRDQYMVIALPIFGAGGGDSDPVGWTIYNSSGGLLPIFKKGEPPEWKKIKQTYGSEPGLIGLHALLRTADASANAAEQTIWSVEGPSDLLALWSAIPPDLRDRHLIITNGNGASEKPIASMLPPFVGRRVVIIRDCDEAGVTSVKRWTNYLVGSAEEIRCPALPYPVTKSHGKDLRDFFSDGHTFDELLDLAEACEVIAKPTDDASEETQPVEEDDDPHRLADVYISRHGRHHEHGLILRYWRDEWHRWDGQSYRKIPNSEIKAGVVESTKQEYDRLNLEALASAGDGDKQPKSIRVTSRMIGDVMLALSGRTLLTSSTEEGTWLDDPRRSAGCVAMANGILDLDQLLAGHDNPLVPHSPFWFSPICLPYPFDPDAECPRWINTLNQNLEGDPDKLSFLQEWAGYCLIPDTGEQKFLVLEGDGSNGKSVYCAGLTAMLGTANVSTVSLEVFGQRFQLAPTIGKLANIAADCGEIDKAAEGQIKSFTSGDRIMIDRKNLPPLDVSPTARLILCTNNRPRFSDRSSGIWRRMIIIAFDRTVPESERVKNMDKYFWWEKSGELSGIFNWAVVGLHRLRQRGGLMIPESSRDAIEGYRDEMTPTRKFIKEFIVPQQGAILEAKAAYEAYCKWCRESGHKNPMADTAFGAEIKRVYKGKFEKRRGSIRTDRSWKYFGLSMEGEF